MQTVVLAAGEGTRMRPLTRTRPKPLLPVANRPLVGHTLAAAARAGASRFVIVVGYRADQIETTIGEAYEGVPVSYVDQGDPEGTADAVRAARPELDDAPFYDATPAAGAIRVPDPSNYGVFETSSESISSVVEKPPNPTTDLANAGAYAFPAAARDWLDVHASERGERELTDVLQRVCDEYDVTPVTFDRWLDVGRPWELLEANEWLLDECERDIQGDVSDDATLRGTVVVEEGATIEPGVVIEGPAIVQRGASVGPNAYIRGATLVGPDAHVGHSVEIKNSVLFPHAHVPHLSYVGDSILGAHTNLGAGTNVANLRHDGANVELTVKGERVSTGRRKFGVVLGDGAKTGINTSLAPGVTLDCEATTMPGESVTRDR